MFWSRYSHKKVENIVCKSKLWGLVGKKKELWQKFKQIILFVILPPKICHCGLKFHIIMTNVTTIFCFLTVNYEEGLMCLKSVSYLPCKLHPNQKYGLILTELWQENLNCKKRQNKSVAHWNSLRHIFGHVPHAMCILVL